MPQPLPPRQPLRLALQFFASYGLRRGLGLLVTRAISRHRGSSIDDFTDRLATPFDLYPRRAPPATHPFDLLYEVDTSGFQHGATLGDASPALPRTHSKSLPAPETRTAAPPRRLLSSALWNTAYYGIAPSIFDRALALVGTPAGSQQRDPPDWSRFTFVDLGCGKGRALLLASRYPFRHILGIELDAALAATAQANLRRFRAPWQQTHSLEVRHADATAADLPLTPLVLYLYNPFLAPALKRVLRRLRTSLRQHPRELWLIYINPPAAHVLHSFPFLRPVARTTLLLDPEDALPDRLGSTQEEVAVFHILPPG